MPAPRTTPAPPGARARRSPWPGILAAVLLAAAAAGPAAAQPNERDAAEVDTTDVERAISSLRPSYNTSLDVGIQRRTWNQQLTFGMDRGDWDFKNNTTFQIQEDIFQDNKGRDGRTVTTFGLQFVEELPVTLVLNLSRRSSDGLVSSRSDVSSLSANTRYGTRRWGGQHTFNFSGSGDVNSRRSENSGNVAITRDSGFRGQVDYRGSWSTYDWITVSGGFLVSRERKNSTSTEGETSVTLPTTAARNGANIKVDYTPVSWFSAGAGYDLSASNNTKFTPVSGQSTLEFQDTSDRNGTLNLLFKGIPGTDITWAMGFNDGSRLFEPASDDPVFDFISDRSNSSNGNNWQGALDTRLVGFNVEAKLRETVNNTDQRATFPQEKINRLFELDVDRKLSLKWDVRASTRVDLRQTFQDTPFAQQSQDFDELRTKLEAGVGYRPNDRWTVNVTWVADNFQRIEQNPLKAGSSKDEVVGSIATRIGYQISERTQLSQTYNIQARYEEFLFAQSNNRSRISRRIDTRLNSRILDNMTIEFQHQWQHLRTGGFGFRDDGTRVVFPASQNYTQDLKFLIEWQATPWLSLRAREEFTRRDDLQETTQIWTTNSRNLFLYEGFKIETDLVAGLTFRAEGEYARSNTRDSYWTVNSMLQKDF